MGLLQVENGIIKSWEDMEHLWNYTFFEKMVVRPNISIISTVVTAAIAAHLLQ